MSFCSEVKSQIVSSTPEKGCCMRAETYGLLLFSHLLTKEKHIFKTEQYCTAQLMSELIAACCGAYVDIEEHRSVGGERVLYSISVPELDQRERILESFDITDDEAADVDLGILELECCREAFVRGAFLAGGTVSAPEKGYHIEISAHTEEICKKLQKILSKQYGIACHISARRKNYYVYVKEADGVEDMLALLGAGDAYFAMIGLRIQRDIQNKTNRVYNCDQANINRTLDAAQEQISAIRLIEKTIGIENLPPELRELAQLRVENSEMSLRELGDSLTTPLSRSGVNHRMKKLMEIAKECSGTASESGEEG